MSSATYQLLCPDKDALVSSVKSDPEPVTIIYATQTNTCKQFANTVYRYITQADRKAKVFNVAEVQPADVKSKLVVYLTCTFFNGEHPKPAQPFVNQIRAKEQAWVDAIKGKYFAVFGIGSTKYEKFCIASDEVDRIFEEFGGVRVQNVSRVDRNLPQGHIPQFMDWLDCLLQNTGIPKVEVSVPVYSCELASKCPVTAPPVGYQWGRLVERRQLSFNVVDGIQVYYKFIVPKNSYKAGQHLAILPRNFKAVVAKIFNARVLYVDDQCTVAVEPDNQIKVTVDNKEAANLPVCRDAMSAWDLVAQYPDLHAQLTQNVLQSFIPFIRDPAQQAEAKKYAGSFEQFSEKFTKVSTKVADLFDLFDSIKVPINVFIEACPANNHRLYSIASSPTLVGDSVLELLVTEVFFDAVDVKTGEKFQQRGKCTGFLHEVGGMLGDSTQTYLDRNGMFPMKVFGSPLEPPADSTVPIISVALGSGYAPFRSLFQEREALQKKGQKLGKACIFLGLRRRSDYGFMLDELNDWCKAGVADAYLAISREKGTPDEHDDLPMTHEKRAENVKLLFGGYVTKSIAQNYAVFGETMTAQNSLILYCGKAGQVPQDLQNYITQALVSCGVEEDRAKQLWVEQMECGRIILEAW